MKLYGAIELHSTNSVLVLVGVHIKLTIFF